MSDASGVALPATASVVVVGAGLSGLVAGRDVLRAGIEDVVVVEAQDTVGGRIKNFVRDDGSTIERGAELTGPLQPTVLELAKEMGIEIALMPMLADPENMGAFVTYSDGERQIDAAPFDGDPEALAAYTAAAASFEELMAGMPADEPWTDPRAAELDNQTVGGWLDENVSNRTAREALEFEFAATGRVYETSLLFTLAFLARHGGMEGFATALPNRLVGGTSRIIANLAAELGERVVVSAPVRKIVRDDDGVVVGTDRGAIRAKAVIVATEPNVAAGIEFEPPLPADRVQLQTRWISSSGAKFFAIYDTPFWVEDGLAGFATGRDFIGLAADFSVESSTEGILSGMIFTAGPVARHNARILADSELSRPEGLADLEAYFGPKAKDPKEFHIFDWHGECWSRGAGGAALPPGVLTAYGHTLRRPVGPIFWAGEASGTGDYMEGAASAGRAAAKAAVREALKRPGLSA